MLESVPCRVIVALMMFMCSCINYMMRVNLSVNLVAMVPLSNHTYSESQVILDWTAYERAQVLASYFWGYVIGSAVGGPVSEKLGPRFVTTISVLTISALTLLSPLASKHGYMTMMILRIILGSFSGVLFPAMHVLISSWATANDRGKYLGALIGGTVGTFLTWTICGVLIESFGWEWGFYFFGILGIFLASMFWYLIYDSPEKHPRISVKEKAHIIVGVIQKPKLKHVPYRQILTSIPFWSLNVITFGTTWGVYFVITAVPNYLANTLGYGISSSGYLSGIIYLLRSSAALGFGCIGDFMLDRNIVTLKVLRKTASVVSHIIPGCIVFCMSMQGQNAHFYVILMAITMTLNGAVTLTNVANGHDLSQHYIGTVMGINLTLTNLFGTLIPFVVAYFTKDDETDPELWRPVFYLGSLIYVASGLQFILFGSTERQTWDKIVTEVNTEEKN